MLQRRSLLAWLRSRAPGHEEARCHPALNGLPGDAGLCHACRAAVWALLEELATWQGIPARELGLLLFLEGLEGLRFHRELIEEKDEEEAAVAPRPAAGIGGSIPAWARAPLGPLLTAAIAVLDADLAAGPVRVGSTTAYEIEQGYVLRLGLEGPPAEVAALVQRFAGLDGLAPGVSTWVSLVLSIDLDDRAAGPGPAGEGP